MANYPLAFGELLAGAILLDKGVQAFKTGLGNTSASSSSTGGVSPSPAGDGLGATSAAAATAFATWIPSPAWRLTPSAKRTGGPERRTTDAGHPPESLERPAAGSRNGTRPGFSEMSAWVSARSMSAESAIGQLTYIASDLATSYPGLLSAMNSASDPADAAQLFESTYERPNAQKANLPNRENFATAVYAAAGY